DRHHAAGGTQDVAETHGHESRAVRATAKERLDANLCEALGRPHDVSWVDGLITRNEYEPLDRVHLANLGELQRAESVVLDRFARVQFHHRHVFVGRRVKHDLGTELFKDVFQPWQVQQVGN